MEVQSGVCREESRLLHQEVKTANLVQNFELNPLPDDKVVEVFGEDYPVFIQTIETLGFAVPGVMICQELGAE